MSEQVSGDRLAGLVAMHETLHGCDDCSPHEVGLMARELAELRSMLGHGGEARATPDPHHGHVTLTMPGPDGRRVGIHLDIAEASRLAKDLAKAADALSSDEWPNTPKARRYYDPVNDSNGAGDSL